MDRGPSPRVRGAVNRWAGGRAGQGAIPARAGSSRASPTRPPVTRGHPRACGEQINRAKTMFSVMGPSPRVRGAECRVDLRVRHLGAIPARAGSRSSSITRSVVRRGHPRACGEQSAASAATPMEPGPSPRVRGADRVRAVVPGGEGAIPARAGSRPSSAGGWPRPGGHPRACGEQADLHVIGHAWGGPSPRVRGAGH